MKSEQAKDRRRFFRINDAIGVSYEVIETAVGGAADSPAADNAADEDHLEEGISISQLLEQHDMAIVEAIKPLEKNQPQMAKALNEINKKLDTLLTLCELEDVASCRRYQHFEQANISACGMGFPASELLPADTKMRLNLFLLPTDAEVSVIARVVDCQTMDADNYYMRVEFLEIDEDDRETLIQHIVQRQSILLKSLREQMEGG